MPDYRTYYEDPMLDGYGQLQYTDMNSHINIAAGQAYPLQGSSMMDYGNGTVALQQNCRTHRPVNIIQRGSEQTTRHRSASNSTSDASYHNSSEPSPTMSSGRPDLLDPRYAAPDQFSAGYRVEVTHQSNRSSQRYYCDHPDCFDPVTGRRSSVSRKADLKRHMLSVHGPPIIDCAFRKCTRRGEEGFCRGDHYREHLRGYHGQELPKTHKKSL